MAEEQPERIRRLIPAQMAMIQNIYFTRKRLFSKIWMLLLNVFVSTVALILLGYTMVMPQILLHDRRGILKAVGRDAVSVRGFIKTSDIPEDYEGYVREIMDSPEIDSFGGWFLMSYHPLGTDASDRDDWAKILEIQKKHVREYDEYPECVQVICMPRSAFKFHDFRFYQEIDGETETGEDETIELYLGYHFREIPLGTVFYSEQGRKYKVVGILKEHSVLLDWQQFFWNMGDTWSFSAVQDLDNLVLICDNDSYCSVLNIFSCADGYHYQDGAERIRRISEKYGIRSECGTFEKRMEQVVAGTERMLSWTAKLSVILFFSTFVILAVTQVLTLISRKDEIGTWVISGIGKGRIFRILFWENMAKLFPAAALAYGTLMVGMMTSYIPDSSIYKIRYIIWGNLPIELLLVIVVLSAATVFVSGLYLYKKSLPDMIRGNWD